LIEACFGHWLPPENIPTRGVEGIPSHSQGCKLVARAQRERDDISASVAVEFPPMDSFLGQSEGPENRIEIELDSGEIIRLRGQGAGRWPTAVSVMGDLHEVARLLLESDILLNA